MQFTEIVMKSRNYFQKWNLIIIIIKPKELNRNGNRIIFRTDIIANIDSKFQSY